MKYKRGSDCVDCNFDEKYVDRVKKRKCFKELLDSKEVLTYYSTFLCPKTFETFSVINNNNIDIEFELVKLCDKKCNIESKHLNLQIQYPVL
jgi:hypothetical protein